MEPTRKPRKVGLAVWLDPADMQQLREAADAEDRPISALARRFVLDGLKTAPTAKST